VVRPASRRRTTWQTSFPTWQADAASARTWPAKGWGPSSRSSRASCRPTLTPRSTPPSGGVLGAVAGAVGKVFGSGAGELLSRLTQLGFSPEQLRAFVPRVLEFLKGKLPPDVLKQVTALIPAQEDRP
jgi:hypothetical protein